MPEEKNNGKSNGLKIPTKVLITVGSVAAALAVVYQFLLNSGFFPYNATEQLRIQTEFNELKKDRDELKKTVQALNAEVVLIQKQVYQLKVDIDTMKKDVAKMTKTVELYRSEGFLQSPAEKKLQHIQWHKNKD